MNNQTTTKNTGTAPAARHASVQLTEADRKKMQEALEVLNYYRNCHYADTSGTESYILANAINDVLPTLSKLVASIGTPLEG